MDTKINKYANLTTVAAILLVVIYSPGKYDGWDFLIGIIGGCFAFKCFRHSYCDDLFSTWLVCIIAFVSLLAILASIASFCNFIGTEDLDTKGKMTYAIAGVIMVLGIVIAIVYRARRK